VKGTSHVASVATGPAFEFHPDVALTTWRGNSKMGRQVKEYKDTVKEKRDKIMKRVKE
jgi:hypothetical protein